MGTFNSGLLDTKSTEEVPNAEMDMGPYLLTQPNPTANGPNPTQPMIFRTGVTQPNQPIFRTVLHKAIVNSLVPKVSDSQSSMVFLKLSINP